MKRLTALVIVCSVSLLVTPFVVADRVVKQPQRDIPITMGFSGKGKFTCLITPDGSEIICTVRVPLTQPAKQAAEEVSYKY